MGLVNLILWLVLGALAGWLASLVMKTNHQQGLFLDIVVGIAGSFIGGFVFGLFGISASAGFIGSLIVAFVGAVILLAIVKAIRRSSYA